MAVPSRASGQFSLGRLCLFIVIFLRWSHLKPLPHCNPFLRGGPAPRSRAPPFLQVDMEETRLLKCQARWRMPGSGMPHVVSAKLTWGPCRGLAFLESNSPHWTATHTLSTSGGSCVHRAGHSLPTRGGRSNLHYHWLSVGLWPGSRHLQSWHRGEWPQPPTSAGLGVGWAVAPQHTHRAVSGEAYSRPW